MNKSNIVFIGLIITAIFLSNLIIGCGDSKRGSKQTLEDKLITAAQFGRSEKVQQLLEKGADPYLVFDIHATYASTLLASIAKTETLLKIKDDPSSSKKSRDLVKELEKNGATVDKMKKTYRVLYKWQQEHPGEYFNPYSKPLVVDANPETQQQLVHVGPTYRWGTTAELGDKELAEELDDKELAEILIGIENLVNTDTFSLLDIEPISNSGMRLVMTTSAMSDVFKFVRELEKSPLFKKVKSKSSRKDKTRKFEIEIEFYFTEQTKNEKIRTEELRSLKEKIQRKIQR